MNSASLEVEVGLRLWQLTAICPPQRFQATDMIKRSDIQAPKIWACADLTVLPMDVRRAGLRKCKIESGVGEGQLLGLPEGFLTPWLYH